MKNTGKIDWKKFWDGYRNDVPVSEDDMLFQVGRTINKKPIPRSSYHLTIRRISELLSLESDDHVLELCCGNGLMTFDLADRVSKVTAVDFADHLIEAARKLKPRSNIQYFCADAREAVSVCLKESDRPTKVLMNAALAYFDSSDLTAILGGLLRHNRGQAFRALFTDVPNEDWMLRFYNTPERLARYTENQKRPLNDNDGLGQWWNPRELEKIASTFNFEISILPQPEALSDYRMDVLISSAEGNTAS